jgi:hypothetical protein
VKLETGMALIEGQVPAEPLIRAVVDAGYQAELFVPD